MRNSVHSVRVVITPICDEMCSLNILLLRAVLISEGLIKLHAMGNDVNACQCELVVNIKTKPT